MYWPTQSRKVPLEDLGWVNTSYLATAFPRCDPTIVWGTTIDCESLNHFISVHRQETGALISVSHVLLRAVVEALFQHPKLNRRVIGRRVYPYDGVHVTMPMLETRTGEVNVIYFRHAEQLSLSDIARITWENAREVAVRASQQRNAGKASMGRWRSWLHLHWIHRMAWLGFFLTNRFRLPTTVLDEINGSSAFVNHLGFRGAPPMISYKPSSLPTNSFGVSVTLGLAEPQPVVEGSAVVIRNLAPLFVRVDHRLVNGYQTAEFVKTLRDALHNPIHLVAPAAGPKPDVIVSPEEQPAQP